MFVLTAFAKRRKKCKMLRHPDFLTKELTSNGVNGTVFDVLTRQLAPLEKIMVLYNGTIGAFFSPLCLPLLLSGFVCLYVCALSLSVCILPCVCLCLSVSQPQNLCARFLATNHTQGRAGRGASTLILRGWLLIQTMCMYNLERQKCEAKLHV